MTVPLLSGAVTTDQTLVAVPYRDTNGNQRYDYIVSGGFQDTAYVNRTGEQAVIVNDTATVSVPANTSGTVFGGTETPTTIPIDTSTPFKVTNLSVSNRSAHVNDELTLTVWIANPTDTRLHGEISLATTGTIVESQEVALFPRESRAVRFTHPYDAPGEYVIKVAGLSEMVRIVEEGAPLAPPTTTTANSGANSSSVKSGSTNSGGLSLSDMILLSVLIIILGGLGWALIAFRRRM